ncbi:MAG: hypothetical protein WBO55_19685 [Rhizobiaceae bacterium]
MLPGYAVEQFRSARPRFPIPLARLVRAGVPAATAITIAMFMTAGFADAAGIDCARADRAAEFAVCSSENLQLAEAETVKLQADLERNASSLVQRQKFSRAQQKWFRERDTCGANLPCLELKYAARLDEMRTASNAGQQVRSSFVRFTGQK